MLIANNVTGLLTVTVYERMGGLQSVVMPDLFTENPPIIQ